MVYLLNINLIGAEKLFSYILKRIFYLIPITFGITFLTFLLLYLSPSDPVTMQYISMGTVGNQKIIEEKKEALGLNDPFIIQYGRWLKNISKGDFGVSIKYRTTVREEMAKRLPKTITLAGVSLMLTVLFALPLGILSAIYKNKIADYIIRAMSFTGISIPTFWLGLLLIYFFSIKLKILPIIAKNGGIKSLIMPSITLSLWLVATYITRLRASILEEINKEYVIGLLSRGISYPKIILLHIVPNSLLSIITMFGASVGAILGGATIVETIFEYQGIGKMAAEAITNRDYFLMQAYVIWMAIIYMLINLIIDILYRYFDPRIRLEGEE